MILTYRVKHGLNLNDDLLKVKTIAIYGSIHRCNSSRQVKRFGMPSAISNAVLRKYGRSRTLKRIKNPIISVPNQAIKWDGSTITITCMKITIPFNTQHYQKVSSVKTIELNEEYAYVACEVQEGTLITTTSFLGVDRNATSHIAVCSNLNTGKVLKLGKSCPHDTRKQRNLRRKKQKSAKYKKHHKYRGVTKHKNREHNIQTNHNHQVSSEIVDTAVHDRCAIILENLRGIRKSSRKYKHSKTTNATLNSWAFYQLQSMIVYKAHLRGVPVVFVDPQWTSQICSRCGHIGNRNGKIFECPHCGHADHADSNAGFNIAWLGSGRSLTDRDVNEGCTDHPNGALLQDDETSPALTSRTPTTLNRRGSSQDVFPHHLTSVVSIPFASNALRVFWRKFCMLLDLMP